MIQFLHDATTPPPLKKPPINTLGHRCAFTGEKIRHGYPLKQVITIATAELSDTFRHPSQFVSVEFAELFRAQTLLRGNLLFLDSTLLQPMVSAESASTQNRPCWRDLIFEMEVGTPTVAVFTDESKRRLWHQAEYSTFGAAWKPFLNASIVKSGKVFKAPQISQSLSVDVHRLRNCINLVERAQAHGFTKRGIYEGLLNESNTVIQFGYPRVMPVEKALQRWRDTDEFRLAVFVAQGTPDPSLVQAQPVTTPPPEPQLKLF